MAVGRSDRMARALRRSRRRGILGLKWGFNPNSSSLAADVSVLLLGATALSILSIFISSWLKLRSRFSGTARGLP